ncbi:MAG: hypothetical protein KatS3mg081_2950 [Gemmatimonadales bacterium]|nr:MAG: hypothetical protein KatS3mg081_2950 [Gemmatimonadales bacterium]
MDWLRENWFWLLFVVFFVWTHMRGHGCHGAHGHRRDATGDRSGSGGGTLRDGHEFRSGQKESRMR